jgi:hypothetical protein
MRGVGGEKETAAAILEKLIVKYGYSMEDLDTETVQKYEVKFKGEQERHLLIQIIYKVLDNTDTIYQLRYTYSGRKCTNQLGVNCTAAQKAEIEFLFDFHKRLWKQEQAALLQAYIQKHALYGNLKDGEKPRELSKEELAKMAALMDGLSNEQPLKQLTNGGVDL